MVSKIKIIQERLKNVSVRGNSWRLVSMVRERILRRGEIKLREQIKRDKWQSAYRELSARLLRLG